MKAPNRITPTELLAVPALGIGSLLVVGLGRLVSRGTTDQAAATDLGFRLLGVRDLALGVGLLAVRDRSMGKAGRTMVGVVALTQVGDTLIAYSRYRHGSLRWFAALGIAGSALATLAIACWDLLPRQRGQTAAGSQGPGV